MGISEGGAVRAHASLDLSSSRLPGLLLGALLACIATAVLAALPFPFAQGPRSITPTQRPHGQAPSTLAPALVAGASASIGASERRFWPRRSGGSLAAQGGGIHSVFSSAGVALHVAGGALNLSLAGFGRGQVLGSLPAVAPAHAANQVLYRYGPVTEVYRNGPFGLEQGFTVQRAPRAGSGSLELALRVGGPLTPRQAGSQQIVFRSRSGAAALRYGELSAFDATGRQLPAHMVVSGRTFELIVDDRRARYPLRIDPFFQQGPKLLASGEVGQGQFGASVAISADGNTAIIAGPTDNAGAGAAWVFTRSGTAWSQQAKLTGGAEEKGAAQFGYSVALSSDGNTALVGGRKDNPGAGTDGLGAAWVFTRSGTAWTQQGLKLTAGPEEKGEGQFGYRVALSGKGDTAVVGASLDNGFLGAAWVFVRSGTTWEHQGAKLVPSDETGLGEFGEGMALSEGGDTAVIGGSSDNGAAGAAWVFTRGEGKWTQQGSKLTGAEEKGAGRFGFSAALSSDGNTALIGGGADNSAAGAAWAFTRSEGKWAPQGPKLTATGEIGEGHFGFTLSLASDGNTALIGGGGDNGELGAAWAFTRSAEGKWAQQGSKLTGGEEAGKAHFGYSVAVSGDASTAVIGGTGDNNAVGAAWAFSTTEPPPNVTSIAPTSGSTAGGTAVNIKGTGFVAGATVTIGNPATAVNVVTATEITATTAATAAGSYKVVVSDVNGTSTGGPSYTYVAPPAPKVTSITPTSGSTAGGTKVTITGSGFVAGATVTIGNQAKSVVVASATKITATTVATPVGSDEVVVTDANGTSSGGPSYTYVPPPPPKVTKITPTSGPSTGATKVTITGTGFVSPATVTIGNEAKSVVVASATKITATTVATPVGPDEVVVTDANGTSSGGPSYTYVPPPPPKVTKITPTSGPSAGATKVTITGTGFVSPATVKIGNEATSVVVASATKITAKTAATPVGSDEVVVTDANGTSTGGPSFTYIGPAVTSIAPTSGPTAGGTPVTIKGSGFVTGATVTIGSAATSVKVVSATEITATTATTAPGSDEVVVSQANGTSTGGPSFTYVAPPPHVTSIEPTSGTTAGGTAVTIKGTGFLTGATVKIGSLATAVNVVSATEITATTSATAAGPDEVVVSDANGTSTGGPSYTYVTPPPPAPTVTSIEPPMGPAAGGTVVTIKGTGFLPGAIVKIGSEATEVLVINETELTAKTAATPVGSDEVVVSDVNGTSTGGPLFKYE
jgi:hypothetical protein